MSKVPARRATAAAAGHEGQRGSPSGRGPLRGNYQREQAPTFPHDSVPAELLAAAVRRYSLLKGDWNKAWLAEHASFPNGQHDDQVDSDDALDALCWLAANRAFGVPVPTSILPASKQVVDVEFLPERGP